MKKHKKIVILLFLVIIVILGLTIYDNIHYSKKEILEIINRNDEQFDNVYIKVEYVKKYADNIVYEIYSKDNIIYDDRYQISEDEVLQLGKEIWNINTKEKNLIDPIEKKISKSKIRGKRAS